MFMPKSRGYTVIPPHIYFLLPVLISIYFGVGTFLFDTNANQWHTYIMQEKQKHELFAIVFNAVTELGLERTTQVIQDAHMGKPMSFVDNNNMHLFRTYRNHVSVDATALAYDAIRSETGEFEYAGS